MLGTLRRLKLDRLLASAPSRERDLCVALIAARLVSPGSKLATTRGFAVETAESTLMDLHIRPIHHHKADRVRAHVLLCMLSYYVEWHMRHALAPLLFDDEDKPAGEALRSSVVAPAERSPATQHKAHTKRNADGGPVHSFATMIRDLATLVKNRVQPRTNGADAFDIITKPTPSQKKAPDLLNVRL